MFNMNYIVNMMKNEVFKFDDAREVFKKRIRDKWNESKKFPRKMKKRIRKELLVDMQIAEYDVFGDYRDIINLL